MCRRRLCGVRLYCLTGSAVLDGQRLLLCGCAASDADADDLEGAPLLRPHIMSAEVAADIGAELRLDIGICSVDRDGGDDVLEVLMRHMRRLLLVLVLAQNNSLMKRREALDHAELVPRPHLWI